MELVLLHAHHVHPQYGHVDESMGEILVNARHVVAIQPRTEKGFCTIFLTDGGHYVVEGTLNHLWELLRPHTDEEFT